MLTFNDVANYCAIPEYTVQAWINQKQLVVCWLTTGKQRYRLIDVIAAHEAHKKRMALKVSSE
jgi:hypothetical protein